ncbi:hypothetical protein M3Y96_00163500 [Aphelenchoides besseyi]|nr:hypothetical protein M3Y96_00163500 [Aphelenchoides besseyi]
MEEQVVEKMNDQATEQSQLVLDCWQKQTEGTNYSDRNDLMTFNHKRLACSQPSILVDAHGDGPEICGLFFPESTIVLITVDGQRIGINRTLLSNKAFSFHLLDLNIKAVEVPAAYEPLVVLISAMYKEEESEIFRLFLKCNAKLLFAVFDVAVVFGAWRILNMLTAVICERSNPSTYVATMQLICKFYQDTETVFALATEQPRFANEMWKMIVGVFYRFKFDSSIVHPNNSNEVDEMEERLTRMLVGSVQEQIPTRPPFSLLLTLGGWSFDGPTTEVEVFDGYRAQWLENPSNLAELPEARCYFAAISMREQKSIVVLGGMNEELYFNSSVSFNLDTMMHFISFDRSRAMGIALAEGMLLGLDIPCFVFTISFTFFVGVQLAQRRDPYDSPYFRVFFVLSTIDAVNYLWRFSRKFVYKSLVLVTLLPLPFLAPRFFIDVHYKHLSGNKTVGIGIEPKEIAIWARFISGVLGLGTGVFCALIEIVACVSYVRYRQQGLMAITNTIGRQRQRLEVKICTYASTMLTIQICFAVYQLVLAYAIHSTNEKVIAIAQHHFVWISDMYSLSGALFMFCSCAGIRKNYVQFYSHWLKSHFLSVNYRPTTPQSQTRFRSPSRDPSTIFVETRANGHLESIAVTKSKDTSENFLTINFSPIISSSHEVLL